MISFAVFGLAINDFNEETEWPSAGPSGEHFAPIPTREEIAASLKRAPKPSVPTHYKVTEPLLWQKLHLPPGSVIDFVPKDKDGKEMGHVGLFVTTVEYQPHGFTLVVRLVGTEDPKARDELQKAYRSGRKRVHICYLDDTGTCPMEKKVKTHIHEFTWFPPGGFAPGWLDAAGKKLVKSGIELEQKAGIAPWAEPPADPGPKFPPQPPFGSAEQKLQALRAQPSAPGRVHFGGEQVIPASSPAPGRPSALRRAGTSGWPAASAVPQLAPAMPLPVPVKQERMIEISDTERSGPSAKGSLRNALASAAVAHNQKAKESRKSKKSKKSSKKSKRKKSKSRHKGSSSSSEDEYPEESSSDDLVPPLKKRAKKTPGSVYQMLEQQALEHLAQDGVLDMSRNPGDIKGKIFTYYQLVLKPHLDTKTRDAKEIALLAHSLDLLREGQLLEVVDILAARLLAVETATRQGWATARHLEVFGEPDGAVPAHILLEAQRHSRQVEKAGGKGSWSRSQTWAPWGADGGGKGKGKDSKGKSKKGDGKGKGQKGSWNIWGHKPKQKEQEAGKKDEA